MSEYKKVVTKLESSVKPISINSEDAYSYAKSQDEENKEYNKEQVDNVNNNIAKPIPANEINPEEFHAVNDVIKVTKKKTPLLTYIIMIAVIVILVAIFIIYELPILRGL